MSQRRKRKNCWCSKPLKQRLFHFQPILKELTKSRKGSKTRAILESATPCFIRLLSEIGSNILKGNIELSEDQTRRLKPHKRLLLLTSKPHLSLKRKKEALIAKNGGFLNIVLPTLISAISALLAGGA